MHPSIQGLIRLTILTDNPSRLPFMSSFTAYRCLYSYLLIAWHIQHTHSEGRIQASERENAPQEKSLCVELGHFSARPIGIRDGYNAKAQAAWFEHDTNGNSPLKTFGLRTFESSREALEVLEQQHKGKDRVCP